MDQQQTHQTEQMIAEMLEFLETSSDDEHDLEPQTKGTCNGADISIEKDLNCNIIKESTKKNLKTKKELNKLTQQILHKSKEIEINHEVKNSTNDKTESETLLSSKFDNLEWQFQLENHCRRNNNNNFTQEVYKAIYQNTTGHPRNGSADYYQAAQSYALYGKHFLDFPKNMEMLLNDKICQNSLAESSSLLPNCSNYLYSKPHIIAPNISLPGNSGPSTAAYYQILNNMQAQTTRSALSSTNPGNSTAYGIFMGNKVTYVAGTPATPSLIYNQHNTTTTTTNFISNSLANAALATSPTILYTNPLLTTTTQQYLTQFLNAAALTSNSIQSTTVSANAGGGNVYERLVYAQMLQQQLYQTQQAASMPALFQNKQRVGGNQIARQTANVINVNSNRSSPALPLSCNSNGVTFNNCYRPGRSTSPRELAVIKPRTSIALAPAETCENSKIPSA